MFKVISSKLFIISCLIIFCVVYCLARYDYRGNAYSGVYALFLNILYFPAILSLLFYLLYKIYGYNEYIKLGNLCAGLLLIISGTVIIFISYTLSIGASIKIPINILDYSFLLPILYCFALLGLFLLKHQNRS